MVTRFTRHARTVVTAAEQEARATGSNRLEAEHVLLAISRLDDQEARGLLRTPDSTTTPSTGPFRTRCDRA